MIASSYFSSDLGTTQCAPPQVLLRRSEQFCDILHESTRSIDNKVTPCKSTNNNRVHSKKKQLSIYLARTTIFANSTG